MITYSNQSDEPFVTITDQTTGRFILKQLKIQRQNLLTALHNEDNLDGYSAEALTESINKLDEIINQMNAAYLITD